DRSSLWLLKLHRTENRSLEPHTKRRGSVLLAFITLFLEAQSYGQIFLPAGPLDTGSPQCVCDRNPAAVYARLLASRRRLSFSPFSSTQRDHRSLAPCSPLRSRASAGSHADSQRSNQGWMPA